MTPEDRESLISRFLMHRPGSSDEYFEAVEDVGEIVKGDPETALAIIQDLLARAGSDEQWGYIAAGPLEDLVRAVDSSFFVKIEAAAQRDPALKEALAGVWVGEEVSREIRDRLAIIVAEL